MSIPGSAIALLLAQSGPSATPTVDYLVVAGGAGGGSDAGGGGGAGGFRTANGFSVTAGIPYTVTVGGGGAGGPRGTASDGGVGVDSVFSTITSTGGGLEVKEAEVLP